VGDGKDEQGRRVGGGKESRLGGGKEGGIKIAGSLCMHKYA